MNEEILEMINQTYKKKGLIQSCTQHYGNFEMIGTRRSFQGNGSLIADPNSFIYHQYYRSTMNLTFLPYAKSIVNRLQEEALYASVSSGEVVMNIYRKLLNIRKEKELCK